MADPRRFDWLFRPQERDEDLPLSAESRFAAALAQLPADERSALALSEIGGLGVDEVAERMGTEPEVASALVARARASMRAALADRAGRLLGALAPLQHAVLEGCPAVRAAGAVAVAALGIGATFDGSTVAPHALAPPQAGGLRIGDIARAGSARAFAATIPSAATPASLAALPSHSTSAPSVALAPATTPRPRPTSEPRTEAAAEPQPSAGQVDGEPRLELVRVPAVAGREIRLDDVTRAVLHLPDVTELVGDEIVGGVAVPEQDRPHERVPVIAAQPRNAEEPGRVQDPDAVQRDGLGVEVEGVEPRLGAEKPLVSSPAWGA